MTFKIRPVTEQDYDRSETWGIMALVVVFMLGCIGAMAWTMFGVGVVR